MVKKLIAYKYAILVCILDIVSYDMLHKYTNSAIIYFTVGIFIGILLQAAMMYARKKDK